MLCPAHRYVVVGLLLLWWWWWLLLLLLWGYIAAALDTGFCHFIGSISIFNLLFFCIFHIF
jgi:hypothetical protein